MVDRSRQVAGPRISPSAMLHLLERRLDAESGSLTALVVAKLSPADRAIVFAPEAASGPLLAEVERRISALIRPGDRFAFASREEVWLLLHDLSSDALAQLAAHSLSNRLSREIEVKVSGDTIQTWHLRPAIGVAWTPAGQRVRPETMLNAACDAADRVHDDEPVIVRQVEPTASGIGSTDLERQIRQALADNALEMHFQPQIELRTNRCDAAEALIRWPAGGASHIDPQTVATTCEERGMIGELTRFTINASMRHMAIWRTRGLDVTVGINLSAAVISDAALPQTVATALATWGVPPQRVMLELTETALINDSGVARSVMNRLHELGCRLSIDDFGTGYSPFTYLRNFPLDELKIDRSFIQPITNEGADSKIVTSLINLAHAFGMKIVAEGVEDEATQEYLRSVGCDFAQGWHVSKALPADAFAQWCLERNARHPLPG